MTAPGETKGRACAVLILLLLSGAASGQRAEVVREDYIIYQDDTRYAAFPRLTQDDHDNLWVGFSWNTTGSHYGSVADGRSGYIWMSSPDGGQTWYMKGLDSQYQETREELHAYKLSDGSLMRVSPLMHERFPMSKKAELLGRGIAVKEWPEGHISASFRVKIDYKPVERDEWDWSYAEIPTVASLGANSQGSIVAGKIIMKPVYGISGLEDRARTAWLLRSGDAGASWDLITMAFDGQFNFTEADILPLPGTNKVLAIIRANTGAAGVNRAALGYLWQTNSKDSGKTWGAPTMTDMWGYPPDLLLLKDGSVLCTYGYRRPPYGIRASFSYDQGKTWDVQNEIIIRSDALSNGLGPGKGGIGDLGYPRTIEMKDGRLNTVYYITLGDGITHIAGTKWSRPGRYSR